MTATVEAVETKEPFRVAVFADEGDRADTLPDHVAGIDVEADDIGAVAG